MTPPGNDGLEISSTAFPESALKEKHFSSISPEVTEILDGLIFFNKFQVVFSGGMTQIRGLLRIHNSTYHQ